LERMMTLRALSVNRLNMINGSLKRTAGLRLENHWEHSERPDRKPLFQSEFVFRSILAKEPDYTSIYFRVPGAETP
ncbi:MAG: hypothetical protein V3U37_02990, partial [Nitrospinaceae bacterium]